MAEEIVKAFESDIESIPVKGITGETEHERVMKTCAHFMLRLWTRIAIETGQKLTMTPYQYSLGIYGGQMKWVLNEALNFRDLPQMELSGKYGQKHALIAESYDQKGEEKLRLVFSLEEEEVKGKPLPVNYLLYDAPLKNCSLTTVSEAVMKALPAWLDTIKARNDAPLWNYCKESLECIGV